MGCFRCGVMIKDLGKTRMGYVYGSRRTCPTPNHYQENNSND